MEQNPLITEQLRQKWGPVIDHPELPNISDEYRKNVTAVLLENQERYLREASPANNIGLGTSTFSDTSGAFNSVAGFDPVLISLVRRAMPNLIAYDVCGVQPMNAPTGLIFAMKAQYTDQGGTEALFNEASTFFSGKTGGDGATGNTAGNAPPNNDPLGVAGNHPQGTLAYNAGQGMETRYAESLGDSDTNSFNEMAFVIDRTSVVAKTRALKAEYTTELAQDLKAVHGLDAETELANILSTEILTEINREVIRTLYRNAKLGAQQTDLYYKTFGGTASVTGGTDAIGGVYDLLEDSDGRWSAERFRGLVYQIEREANVIAKETRRGKGNIIITTSDVASALAMSGFLNLTPSPNVPGYADDTGNTFVGTLNGSMKVYIDPYSATSAYNYIMVGYKGSSPYDAGMFYCPYIPLQMVRAVGENSFQPKIGFKTRYGLVNNPFVSGNGVGSTVLKSDPHSSAAVRCNQYYRIFRVDRLHGGA
jgi:hypothetical protein